MNTITITAIQNALNASAAAAAAKAQELTGEIAVAAFDCIHVPLERILDDEILDCLTPDVVAITKDVLKDVGVIDITPMAKEFCQWQGVVKYAGKDAAIFAVDDKYKCFVTVEGNVATVYITRGFRDCGERLIATNHEGCFINGNTNLRSTFLDGVAFAIREM